ncbi:MAG: molybdopterin molybdenumtransferase MoeA [Bacilli bacterium]|nr:molybdopterin molybdenumtransferase MoeA [Bacilli bacterium]
MEQSDFTKRFQRKAIQVDEAQVRIQNHIRLGDIEEVQLEDAIGRRAAVEIIAPNSMPHFRRSGMDGFAIMAESTTGATSENNQILEVIETIACGAVPTKEVTLYKAARIMTGAMVPLGANAVIMFEMTESLIRNGKTYISISKEIKNGHNITPIGLELTAGEVLLEKGRKIQIGEMAILAAFGFATLPVFKRPQVAILATGSELLNVNEPLQPGKIRNSNMYMLAAQVLDAGGIPLMMDSIPDELEKAKEKILEAYHEADFVITTGGVSVGDYDTLTNLFMDWEGTLLFNKVTMRPGSPTTVGVWNDKFLFALSGNPGACFVGFELFVRPVIWGMQGKKEIGLPKLSAYLAEDFTKVNAYQRYIRGKMFHTQGKLYVKPTGMDQSSVTLTIKDSNCLIIIPSGSKGVQAGELVTIMQLSSSEGYGHE